MSCGQTQYPLCIFQGTTYEQTVEWIDDETKEPIPLTGYTARLQIRDAPGATDPLVSLTESSGIVIDGPAGLLTFTISDTLTAALPVETGLVYQLWIEKDGKITNFMYGPVSVVPRVIEDE